VILVTGGTGFIGTHLLERFAARGESVRALVRATRVPRPLPAGVETVYGDLASGAGLEEALRGADVIMLLRLQKERLAGQKIRLQDYITRYQMTAARLKLAKRDAIVMHPGPIIRGLELTAEVADGPQSVIIDEVHNGVPTRMAILARALGKAK
jgi:aspartate carbamoyltransferase catalytic subunit